LRDLDHNGWVRTTRVLTAVLTAAAIGGVSLTPTATAPAAADPPTVLDCENWRYGPDDEPPPGVLPAEYDPNDYKRTSRRDERAVLHDSPQNLCGQKGSAVDLAWGRTKGRDDVVIAVLDSGIKWRNSNDMQDLAAQAYLNAGEALPSCPASDARRLDPDCNGDGRFDISDFGAIADRNGNGTTDPEDLILDPLYSDGVDDDRNGYVDDISGWDFLYGDNNPLDTVDYGHGTGEAKDSTAADNGAGDVGNCPGCRFLPVRVGDSFIADGGRFAAGVLFALDSGADVVQEALGAINNPQVAQQAIDAGYRRGVVVVASMADEASKHANLPSALDRTMAVNSVTELEDFVSGESKGWLALNGCTNFGGRTFVSVESGSCSSEATGQSAGIVGLLVSRARELDVRLTANEQMQLVRASADDIDFSTPNAFDPANNFGTSDPTALVNTVRYPTTAGWDATFGYGRLNAYELLRDLEAGLIPPEADITEPRWFSVLPTAGTLAVRGRVAASRARSYDYRVEWAVGLQPPLYPATDTWHVARQASGLHKAQNGTLATIDLAQIAAALPDGGTGAPAGYGGRHDEDRFAVRVRVVVEVAGPNGSRLRGIDQHQLFVHDDPDLVRGFPRWVAGAGTSSPFFADIDGEPGEELVLATDDGRLHAVTSNGREVRGFPVRTDTPPWWPSGSRTAARDHIAAPGSQLTVGAPLVTDLDGDGSDGAPEIVAADLDGRVYVWDSSGRRRAGFPVAIDPAFSQDSRDDQDERNRTKPGIAGSPAAADLNGDGDLEIVAAALDRHVYAWNANGEQHPGFPVLVVDPAKVQVVDPATHRVTFTPDSGVREGGELVASVALADLTGDGRAEIVIGAQEAYEEPINIGDGASVLALLSAVSESGNTRVYAISPDGTNGAGADTNAGHPDEQAYLPGWPADLGMIALEVLPTLGGGVMSQAAIGDVHPSPGLEIVASSPVGPLYVLNVQGRSVYGQSGGHDLPVAWAGGLFGEGLARFGKFRNTGDLLATTMSFSGASIGRINLDAYPDLTAPTGGLSRLIDVQAPDLQLPNDDQIAAWNPRTGNALLGFPREVADIAFFVTPAIADVDGDGRNETIAGNGVQTLSAVEYDGTTPAGWPKLTGGWLVGTPGVGDWDGDGRAELVVVRRDGLLLMWHTNAPADSIEWPRYGGNNRGTGQYSP